MGKLIDFYGDFERATHICRKCSWFGLGFAMPSGESFGDGVDKECPQCGERWGFVQWSIAVADDTPEGWEANVGRVVD
jgi:hypothetical protein